MAAFLVLTGISAATVLSAVSFIPLYLVDIFGYAEAAAAVPVALFYSTGLWAAVTGGWLSDRIGSVRVVGGFAVLSAPVVAVLSLVGSDVAVVALLLLLGIGMYARAPASEAYIVGRTPAGQRSTVLGLYYFGSMEGSGVLAPVFGYLIDRFGFTVAFGAGGAVLLVVAVACVLVLMRDNPRD